MCARVWMCVRRHFPFPAAGNHSHFQPSPARHVFIHSYFSFFRSLCSFVLFRFCLFAFERFNPLTKSRPNGSKCLLLQIAKQKSLIKIRIKGIFFGCFFSCSSSAYFFPRLGLCAFDERKTVVAQHQIESDEHARRAIFRRTINGWNVLKSLNEYLKKKRNQNRAHASMRWHAFRMRKILIEINQSLAQFERINFGLRARGFRADRSSIRTYERWPDTNENIMA